MSDLPKPAKEMYDELSSELRALIRAWRYVYDLTNDQFKSNAFNRVSEEFFGTVLSALFSYGLTILARLLDPPRTGKHENCSLQAMLAHAHAGPPAEDRAALNELRASADGLLDYRNKQIAHRDRLMTLEPDDDKLSFSWVRMQKVLEGLQQFMNAFERSAGLPIVDYASAERPNDVDALRRLLRKGRSA